VEPLILVLKHSDDRSRYWAAVALGQINDSRAQDLLIEAMGDGNATIRMKAEWALRSIEGARAGESLVELLKNNNEVRRMGAVEALGDTADARAVEPLIQALGDNYSGARIESAGSLGKLNDSRAIAPLIQIFRDNESEVRTAAVNALVEIGKPATYSLIQALKEDRGQVRLEEAVALEGVADSRAIESLIDTFKNSESDVRRAAVDALVNYPPMNWRACRPPCWGLVAPQKIGLRWAY
jgi:HEAT repeat protein